MLIICSLQILCPIFPITKSSELWRVCLEVSLLAISPTSLHALSVPAVNQQFYPTLMHQIFAPTSFRKGVEKRPVFVVFDYEGGGRGGSAEMQKDYEAFL